MLPDTLFFSLWKLHDPFPAPVHPLATFPKLAPRAGITDAYAVFQSFLEGLVGLRPPGAEPNPFAGLDLRATLSTARISLHGAIYPGGGFVPTAEGIEGVRILASRLDTVFSYVPEIVAGVPEATPVDQAFTDTRFYVPSIDRWEQARPLVCLFAADSPPRKGINVVLRAFSGLDYRDWHLHVVGPHAHRDSELDSDLATFHGWLSPAALRDLHRQTHIFVSPVSREPPGPPGSQQGVVDGFPTQSAADAMSSGCLLVSANPAADHRVLEPDVHYVKCAPNPRALRETLLGVGSDMARARDIAAAGCGRVRSRMDVRRGVTAKLTHMGFPV